MIRLTGFDLETTGPDPTTARVVQYGFAHVGGGRPPEMVERLVDPGVEVPEEAANIHGFTTAMVQAEGMDIATAVTEIVTQIAACVSDGRPLVGHNVSFDLTVLDRECRRHLGEPLETLVGGPVRPVVDTLVLSKRVDPYRRRVSDTQGAHQLRTCVEQMVTPKWPTIVWQEEKAHGALYDCRMSLYVAVAALSRPPLAGVTPEDLHDAQAKWRVEQCASFQEYLRRTDPDAVVDGRWPIIPPEPRQEPLPL